MIFNKKYDIIYIQNKGKEIKNIDSEGCLAAVLAVIFLAMMLFLVPWIELWLWGIVMIPVFGAPALTYWQMFGLNLLCGLLFGRGSNINTSNK